MLIISLFSFFFNLCNEEQRTWKRLVYFHFHCLANDIGIIDVKYLLIWSVDGVKVYKSCLCDSFESHNTLFLTDVRRSSKIDICFLEGIKSDLSKILGKVINTMASYLFFTFYLELQLWNISLKLFNCITQLKSVDAKLFLLISEFIRPKWTETGDFFLLSSNLERILLKFCLSKISEKLLWIFFTGK